MKTKITLLVAAALLCTSAASFAANRGERIERHFDRRGDRIEQHYDHRAIHAAANGHLQRAARLDRTGDRIDRRFDRRGERLENRWDRQHGL